MCPSACVGWLSHFAHVSKAGASGAPAPPHCHSLPPSFRLCKEIALQSGITLNVASTLADKHVFYGHVLQANRRRLGEQSNSIKGVTSMMRMSSCPEPGWYICTLKGSCARKTDLSRISLFASPPPSLHPQPGSTDFGVDESNIHRCISFAYTGSQLSPHVCVCMLHTEASR